MPTEEWCKENPKVAAYISRELNERLLAWMEQRGIKKVSQALTAILEKELEASESHAGAGSREDERLAALEEKVDHLAQIVLELRDTVKAGRGKSDLKATSARRSGQLSLLESEMGRGKPGDSSQ
ncbi:MAG: hypothetical protein ACKO7W_20895 [Elainella sp.]